MNLIRIALALLLVFTYSQVCLAQTPTVDPAFVPVFSTPFYTPSVFQTDTFFRHAIQPDGKVIVVGSFSVVNRFVKNQAARIHPDGVLESTFNCPSFSIAPSNVVVQPDGKVLISVGNALYRFNSNCSPDNTFNYIPQSGQSVDVRAVAPDGQIYIRIRTSGLGGGGTVIYRLNTDGSRDTSFSMNGVSNFANQKIDVKILPDGRVFAFGNTPLGFLYQLNPDGSKSTAFEAPTLSGGLANVDDFSLQSDGKYLIIGTFTTINGVSRTNVARLNANQSVDLDFNTSFTYGQPSATNFFGNGRIFALSNNKILIGTDTLSTQPGKIQRLNNDGSTDNTFTPPTNITTFHSMLIDSQERIYANVNTSEGTSQVKIGLIRYNADGTRDLTYATLEQIGDVRALGLQSDGKILVGGGFEKVNGVARRAVSRINVDGSIDASFDTGEKFTGTINDFAVQPDGKIIVAGSFTYNGTAKKFVRLNSDGTLDTGFNTANPDDGTGSVQDVKLQSDGKILIAGNFASVNGTAKTAIARLNSDGSLDNSFNVLFSANATLSSLLAQADGKIMVGGTFSGINGFNRTSIVRLNSDGTLDSSFNPTSVTGTIVEILRNFDGKCFVLSGSKIHKLNTDGSNDSGFNFPTTQTLTALVLLDDNTLVVGGEFTSINGAPRNRIARIKQDGTLDTTSLTTGSDTPPKVFLKQPDGKLLAGGVNTIEGKNRASLARLVFTTIIRPANFDFDGDGRADISVYRPSNSNWYQLVGQNYQFVQKYFGTSEDIVTPADFDGDGKTDLGVFRPSTGTWWYAASTANGAFRAAQWGQSGDIPLPSDIDGDGKANYVVYRPSNSAWYRLTANNQSSTIYFGLAGDKPLIGDFDGDGKADPAIYRPSTGAWWYAASSANNAFRAVQWGISTDIPVPADYDGDGKTDFAVYRPSNGGWYILNSGNGTATIQQFGLDGDKPIAADYDGDGKADIAVFRPSNGGWYLMRSTAGFGGFTWGTAEDIPNPNAFIQP